MAEEQHVTKELSYFTGMFFSELESEVEMVRLDVVQKRCIGNPAEVDSLNSQLSIISRQVSTLKSKSSSGGNIRICLFPQHFSLFS